MEWWAPGAVVWEGVQRPHAPTTGTTASVISKWEQELGDGANTGRRG